MDDREIRLECLKVAAGIVSNTVADRATTVVETATMLYNHVNSAGKPPAEADKPRQTLTLPKPRNK